MFVFKKSKCSSRPRLPLPKVEAKVSEEKPEIVKKAAPKKQKAVPNPAVEEVNEEKNIVTDDGRK